MRGKGGTGKSSNKEAGRTVKIPNRTFGRYQGVRKIHRETEIKKGRHSERGIRSTLCRQSSYRILQDRNLTEL